MEFDSVVKKRKSVRSFLAKKPSWKTVLEAIDAANQSPFAGNMNNLKFLIIEEKETIKKLAKFAEQHWISQVGIVVLVCSDETHLENKYGERGRIYSRQQAGSAIHAFLLKLADLNLSACFSCLASCIASFPNHTRNITARTTNTAEKNPQTFWLVPVTAGFLSALASV